MPSVHNQPTSEICSHCGRGEASCVGMYEDMDEPAIACDQCCGHANESGRCFPLGSDEATAAIARWHTTLQVS